MQWKCEKSKLLLLLLAPRPLITLHMVHSQPYHLQGYLETLSQTATNIYDKISPIIPRPFMTDCQL